MSAPIDPEGTLNKAATYAIASVEPSRRLWQAHLSCSPVGCTLWYDPERDAAHVGLAKEATDEQAAERELAFDALGFREVTGSPLDTPPPGFGERAWLLIKAAADPDLLVAKPKKYTLPEVEQLLPGQTPLSALIAGGLLGGGLGYLGGSVADAFDDHFRPRHYRGDRARRGALLGALVGVAPPLLWGTTAHSTHPETPGFRAWLSGWPFRPKDADEIKRACAAVREELGLEKTAFWVNPEAPFDTGVAEPLPTIHVDSFGRTVWRDPNTPEAIRAATVGLIGAASQVAGNAPFVNPYDVANVSFNRPQGFVVGQTLAAMGSLSPSSRNQLQSSGVWADMLTRVVPNAFPDTFGPAWR